MLLKRRRRELTTVRWKWMARKNRWARRPVRPVLVLLSPHLRSVGLICLFQTIPTGIELENHTAATLARMRRDSLVRLCTTRDIDVSGTKPQLAQALIDWVRLAFQMCEFWHLSC